MTRKQVWIVGPALGILLVVAAVSATFLVRGLRSEGVGGGRVGLEPTEAGAEAPAEGSASSESRGQWDQSANPGRSDQEVPPEEVAAGAQGGGDTTRTDNPEQGGSPEDVEIHGSISHGAGKLVADLSVTNTGDCIIPMTVLVARFEGFLVVSQAEHDAYVAASKAASKAGLDAMARLEAMCPSPSPTMCTTAYADVPAEVLRNLRPGETRRFSTVIRSPRLNEFAGVPPGMTPARPGLEWGIWNRPFLGVSMHAECPR